MNEGYLKVLIIRDVLISMNTQTSEPRVLKTLIWGVGSSKICFGRECPQTSRSLLCSPPEPVKDTPVQSGACSQAFFIVLTTLIPWTGCGGISIAVTGVETKLKYKTRKKERKVEFLSNKILVICFVYSLILVRMRKSGQVPYLSAHRH